MENEQAPKFDVEVAISKWVMGMALTWVANKVFHGNMDNETTTVVGGILGAVYDFIAFRVKTWIASRKKPE